MGALPLRGLYHSATGGGLLADLPSVTCFAVNVITKGQGGGSHEATISRVRNTGSGVVVFTDAWICEEDIYTGASSEISHDTYAKRF